jgi:hypothetical protein
MHKFERPTPVTVALRAHAGQVELTAEERGTVEVSVTPVDDSAAAREAAEQTRVTLDGDTLLIEAPGTDSWSWRRTPKLRITARVPAGSTLTGKTAAADVRADGVWSAARLVAASAGLTVAEVLADADLESASGDVTVTRIGGALRAQSSSGRLRLGDVAGDVDLRTASGDIRLGSAGGSARLASASGDIEIGELRQGRTRVKTASGDVRVGVAPGTGVWLDLDTSSGRSVSDLTAHGESVPAAPAILELRVRTASGDIFVSRATTARAA